MTTSDHHTVDLDNKQHKEEPECQLPENKPNLNQELDKPNYYKGIEPWEWPEIEDKRKRAALVGFRETGNVTAGCRAAAVSRPTWYVWCERDKAFGAAVEELKEQAVERLEEEAYHRATEGVTVPTGWYKGKPGAWVQQKSDNLLMFLLKGNLPSKYADRVELKGAMANLDLTRLPDHLVERIAAGEHPMAVLASAQGPEPAELSSGDSGDSSSDSEDAETPSA